MNKLVLVAGPSGSGKDTILSEAKKFFKGDQRVKFTRRCINRPPDSNEDNLFLSNSEYDEKISDGSFLTYWRAHGNRYGILQSELSADVNILSVSRAVIPDILKKHTSVTVAEITANRNVLKERLLARGRETEEEVEKRLSRQVSFDAENKVVIDNSETLSDAVNSFTRLVEKLLV